MARTGTGQKLALLLAGTITLTACESTQLGGFFDNLKPQGGAAEGATSAPVGSTSTKLVERDVEAPEVFQVTDKGLWDGRPSLGGVWVAHADVTDPERVIIRNTANGKFVIGALFKREVTAPGPGIQVSSDAAEALGMLAGSPTELNVTALRREEVAPAVAPTDATAAPAQAEALASEGISATTLDGDPIAEAAAALDAIDREGATSSSAIGAQTAPAPKPAKTASSSSLNKPYLQIGIFSVQGNANRTKEMLASQGVIATIKQGESAGKKFWRVVAGPANNTSELKALLAKVKKAGFTDAYAVTH
ncbi:SPOR domain-containing protein [Celeribacter sp.]|uniref:SPOR domain-containing protein n=1 Tax=Celeribacter sp. TaxID=1890673 RepID=UPI003A955529